MVTNIQAAHTDIAAMDLKQVLRMNWQWLLGLGIALVVLGTVSILEATLTTVMSVIIFGAFLLINSGLLIYQAIKIYWGKWSQFYLQLGIGILYAFTGIMFIGYPIQGAISLTLLLAISYIILGVGRAVLAVIQRMAGWSWMLLSALVTLTLGILILVYWPVTSLWIIGALIGVDILFTGWAFIMSALYARSILA